MIAKEVDRHNSFEEETQDYTGIPSAVALCFYNHSKYIGFADFDIIFGEKYSINEYGLNFSNCVLCSDYNIHLNRKFLNSLKRYFKKFNKENNLSLLKIVFIKVDKCCKHLGILKEYEI